MPKNNSSTEETILRHLDDIAFRLGDLNAIRNGEYDPPRGADPDSKTVIAQPDDILIVLQRIVSLLERQNQMIYLIGQNAVQNEDYWHQQNRDV